MTIDVRAAGLSLFSPEIEMYLGDGDNSGAFEDGNCSRELLKNLVKIYTRSGPGAFPIFCFWNSRLTSSSHTLSVTGGTGWGAARGVVLLRSCPHRIVIRSKR